MEQNGIAPTRLCCRTADAQMINQKKLFELPDKEYKFQAFDSGPTKTLDEHTPVEKYFVLKSGAQVMLLKNISISSGLVNGARGVVKSFDKNGLLTIKF
jgi:ATP-dependent DNA helicase PIF1